MMRGPILFVAMVLGVIAFVALLGSLCGGEGKPAQDPALAEAEALRREVMEMKRRLVLEKGR